ncbi:hypothetical protein M8C21_020680 [Ambrosia artemisiifolia]|uniref:Uncharacterized protein n=1 Tax=Ambrosia artemisiifolia TaxID=4212 RepID=A0AAD5GRB8_AMBAR|nr:hypothetical protein M8C21_020680 [Ambrosia artemisiifolia]
MASVEVEPVTNNLQEKVESTHEASKEIEPIVATPPAPEAEVEEPTKEPLTIDAPALVEEPPVIQDPIETETKAMEEPKNEVEEVKAEATQEEVKQNEESKKETLATTDVVAEETSATIDAVAKETQTSVTEEVKKHVKEDEKSDEVVASTEVAKEE